MSRQRLRRYASMLVVFGGLALVAFGLYSLLPKPSGHAVPRGGGPIAGVISPGVFPSGPLGPTPPDGTRIRLVDVGIDLPVVPGDGWNAPLYKAATYPGLRLPGEGGRAVIYAHARRGMFGTLIDSRVGQPVEVDLPDGRVLHYVVTEVDPSWPATNIKWLQPLDHEELVLVTCTTYNPNDPRVVVVARPIT